MNLKNVYLSLAIVGAAALVSFSSASSIVTTSTLAAILPLYSNAAAGGFAADLLISFFVFARQAKGPSPWSWIILSLVVGLSCALPAHLYANSRAGEKPAQD